MVTRLISSHRHRTIQRRAGRVSPIARPRLRQSKMEQGTDTVYINGMAVSCQKASSSRINAGLLIGLLLSLGLNTAFSQSRPPRQQPPMAMFEAYAPKVGERLPDISVHDDLGNLVNIRELANENYKVLVLGCLT